MVTGWEPYAIGVLSIAVLTRFGWIWLAAVSAGIASVWIVSQVGSSFWLDGVLAMLMPLLSLAAAGITGLVSWRIAVAWCGMLLVISSGFLFRQQTREDLSDSRFGQRLASLIEAKGPIALIKGNVSLTMRAALRHYAPDLRVAYLPADDSSTPAWRLDGSSNCPDAEVINLTESTVITYCP